MDVLDLKCGHSFSSAPLCPSSCKNSERMLLGRGYQIFLYFEVPPCIGMRSVKQARLILFKIPEIGTYCYSGTPPSAYFAYPLLEFYSPYGCMYAPPYIDDGRGTEFCDAPDRCTTEVDVTGMVNAWLENSIENKGLLLTASEDSSLIVYASHQYESRAMNPMLRLVCEDIAVYQPLSMRSCDVELRF